MRNLSILFARVIIISISAVLLSTPSRAAQVPSNDLFINRILLAGFDVASIGSNTNATQELGEPSHSDNPGGKSL